MTPAARRMKRRLERRQRDALRGRLGRQRYDHLINKLAAFMRREWQEDRVPTLLAHEGNLRHSVRSALCLQGWKWESADEIARDLVQAALDRVGAKRPTWLQGQREFEERFINRTRCKICHFQLPEGRRVFCSSECGSVFDARLHRVRYADEGRAYELIARERDAPR
ncbi:hypothetical protein [Qingshengfaniella alkalisoli]|uniref:Uncharacterized protein n=1 Tax=Qingshengfaniella alkalisoli TaxID=2599296 RepID=A0A5B8IUL6_9RHOB|nr:hypothetical protein [Qingshengfaniella alkalisoli]QDY69812.1 hypothetical protein FPZ52_09385 [Qingshengfaniella alkalisoli]